MTTSESIPSTDQVRSLSAEISRLSGIVSQLEEAAKIDMEPRIDRLQTMEGALRRDLAEIGREKGADEDVTGKLYTQLSEETHRLKYEIEALAQGNPTTISAVGDAAINAMETVASEASEKVEQAVDALQAGVDSIRGRLSEDEKK